MIILLFINSRERIAFGSFETLDVFTYMCYSDHHLPHAISSHKLLQKPHYIILSSSYLQKPHCLINTILILHLVRGRQFQGNMPSEGLGHSGQAPVLGGQ